MESLIAPLSQDLADGNELSREQRANLDEILARPAVRERILSVNIWKDAGLVAYARDPDLIGQKFEPKGDLFAGVDELDHDESEGERVLGVPLLEVYTPIHSIRSGYD